MPTRKTTIGQDARDLVSSETGEGARNISTGKDISHATADVNIALGQVAAMSERELSQIAELASELAALREDVTALVREIIGNEKYNSPGIVQRLGTVEARQVAQRLTWGLLVLSDIVLWILLIYWLVTKG